MKKDFLLKWISSLFIILCVNASFAQVRLFPQENYGSNSLSLVEGNYSYNQLRNKGISEIGSIKVPKGCHIEVFSEGNFQGKSAKTSKSIKNVKTSDYAYLADTKSFSIKVKCGSMSIAVPQFTVSAADEEATKGEHICIDISVSDFNKIVSMQYSMRWDPKVIQFKEVIGFGLKNLSDASFGLKNIANGLLGMAWYDNDIRGVSLADGSVIYQLCFEVIGQKGSKTRLQFTEKPVFSEIMQVGGIQQPFGNTGGLIRVN